MSALTFIARVPLFCARCGSAVHARNDPDDVGNRIIVCLHKPCPNSGREVKLNDPKIVLLERPSDMMPSDAHDPTYGALVGALGH